MSTGRCAVALLGLVACGHAAGEVRPHARGQPIDLTLATVDGGELSLASLRGHALVVHVFATWSLAAQADLDELRRARAATGVGLVGIGLDPDGRALIAPWRDAAGVDWPLLLPDPPFRAGDSPLGAVTTVPTTILLDAAGRVAWSHVGGLGRGELERAVRELGVESG